MEDYAPKKLTTESIYSVDNLLAALGISDEDYSKIQALETKDRYTAISLYKKMATRE